MFTAGHFPKLISNVLFTPENLLYFLGFAEDPRFCAGKLP